MNKKIDNMKLSYCLNGNKNTQKSSHKPQYDNLK